ncbi:hypothetical protein IWQ57_001832 [Coemansia nantahalensis]|uniref:Uncharacterized protein n=2 Tax=Coemansia TaxID=4863 RepID=A0ACC1LBM4_9FUNG|nr:hypothetical protein IWQ57_001832 [Coemansia nantahalensis]KAJ2804763.1 hypothetical protein H4R21_001515 [Coemansia helicoidea]
MLHPFTMFMNDGWYHLEYLNTTNIIPLYIIRPGRSMSGAKDFEVRNSKIVGAEYIIAMI